MPHAAISSALTEAGIRLLNTLIDRAQDIGEQTDDPIYIAIEHWAREVQNAADLNVLFHAAQDEFAEHVLTYSSSDTQWMDVFAALLENGGEAARPFASNLWRAYFFRLEEAADILWTQYLELAKVAAARIDQPLPRSWGDWILPVQAYMGIVEARLIAEFASFERLLASQDVVELLEGVPAEEPVRAAPRDTGTTFIPSPHWDATATLLAYLTACAERVGRIDPRGLPGVGGVSIPISDIFTPLRLVSLAEISQPGNYVRYQVVASPNQEDYLVREPLMGDEAGSRPGLTPGEVFMRHDEVLVLGDVGSGKTTLLRHTALDYARGLLDDQQASFQIETRPDGSTRIVLTRPLPIYVDLARFVDERSSEETLSEYTLRISAEMVGDQGVVAMLARFLETGQCILLLDGLDQVATDDQRQMLVEAVTLAAEAWRRTGNKVVVSSRLVGYISAPLPDRFEAYVIRPLDRSQIGAFLLRWSVTLARLHRPTLRDDEAIRAAQSDTLTLVRAVTTNPQLGALAATPLILRLLIGFFHANIALAPQRVAVYQVVADGLIRDWHLPQTAAHRPAILEQEAIDLLGNLAFWLHASRPGGTVSEDELVSILSHIWKQLHPDAPAEQARAAADDFIGRLNSQTGVFVELKAGRYGFVHSALQEYFAARYLISSYRLAPERIRTYLHDPRWDEVIRLAINFTAMRSQEDASDLIETAVLARGERFESSPFENWLKRDLLFAARLLASGVEARPAITQDIVRELVNLWIMGDRDSLGRFNAIFDSARRHLSGLDGALAGRRALLAALDHLGVPDEYCRAFAADAVTFWPAYLGEAHDALVRAGRDAPPLVRRAVAQALGRLPALNTEGYRLLLSLVNDTEEKVAEAARATLHSLPPIPQDALGMFVDLLRAGPAAGRRVSLRQLAQVGSLPPSVVNELIHLLSDPDPDIRQGAMDALANVTHLPDNALLTITRMAMDTRSGLRLPAVNALCRPVELPRDVIDHLIDWTYDPEVAIRRASALALATCLNRTPEVMDTLMERLDDPVDSVRADVAEPLAIKYSGEPKVRHLLAHAVSDPTHRVRVAVATALKHFPQPDTEVRHALKTLLSDREMIVREAALETIAHLQQPGDELVEYVVSLVLVQDYGIGGKAVRTLASLRHLPQEALLALVRALPLHWETEGRAIADCLKAHHPLGMDVISEIMDRAVSKQVGRTQLSQPAFGLRALALEILGHALDEAPDVFGLLLRAAVDAESPEVQIAALRGLGHNRVLWPEVKKALIDLLGKGPLHVRCAAGVTLGRLIHHLPNPALSAEEMTALAEMLSGLLREITPRAAWEPEAGTQNDLLRALNWVVARSKPSPPRLVSRVGTD